MTNTGNSFIIDNYVMLEKKHKRLMRLDWSNIHVPVSAWE
jgi:hypothetical protein